MSVFGISSNSGAAPSEDRTVKISVATLLFLILIDAVASVRAGFTVSISEPIRSASIIAAGILLLHGIERVPRYEYLRSKLNIRYWISFLYCILYAKILSDALLLGQALAVSTNAPLIDNQLIKFDAVLGFHWNQFAEWYSAHPTLLVCTQLAYLLWLPQVTLAMLILPWLKRFDDLWEFCLLFQFSAIVSIVVAIPFPASNPFFHYGWVSGDAPSPWSTFYSLRDGSLRLIDFKINQGLVSFPSMHAAAAVILTYAMRHTGRLFPVSVLLNLLMIFSAIYQGAHYLVDILAGLLLSFILIALNRFSRRKPRFRRSQDNAVVFGESPADPTQAK